MTNKQPMMPMNNPTEFRSGREILARQEIEEQRISIGDMLPFQRINFAQAAMQGILANTRFDFVDMPDELADAAFKIADAMMKRSKQP